jgi:hypothetical protein
MDFEAARRLEPLALSRAVLWPGAEPEVERLPVGRQAAAVDVAESRAAVQIGIVVLLADPMAAGPVFAAPPAAALSADQISADRIWMQRAEHWWVHLDCARWWIQQRGEQSVAAVRQLREIATRDFP